MSETVTKYRGETLRHNPGFAYPYMWLGTIPFKTLEDAKAAIDNAPWNQK